MGARYDVALWVHNAYSDTYHWENVYQGSSLARALLTAARLRFQNRRTGLPVQVILR